MGSDDRTSISTNHRAYKRKVEIKKRESIKEERRNEIKGSKKKGKEKQRRNKIDSRIKLVIRLVSKIKEQPSSDFVENNFFNTTLSLFILLSSESFPVFV